MRKTDGRTEKTFWKQSKHAEKREKRAKNRVQPVASLEENAWKQVEHRWENKLKTEKKTSKTSKNL